MVSGVKTSDCLDLLFQTFEEGTSSAAAIAQASDMIQPGILKIGSNYLIKIGNSVAKIDNANLQSALAYVLGFFYVLSTGYPLPLKFVFLFFEALCGIPYSISSVQVKNFMNNVTKEIILLAE